MSRRNTEAWNMIHSMCRLKELDEKRLYERSKRLLTIYRKVCWVTADRADRIAEELVYYCGSQLDDALVYLEEFAPDEDREKFEDRIRSLFQTRWMVEMMDNAMLRVREYPDGGDVYFEIISKCYLTRWKYTESEMLELLRMERSRFYDKKKEAVMIFGLALWGKSIPEMKRINQVSMI